MATRILSSGLFGDDSAWWTPGTGDPSVAAGPAWEEGAVSAKAITATATTSTGTALYLTEAGDTTAINVDDIHQGSIGDCFLLSPMGEIALWDPGVIQGMIHANSNGTETVTLYLPHSNGHGGISFQAVSVSVTNSFPSYSVDNGTTQDVVNGIKEIWPQVLEKAVATLEGGYAAIANGGSPVVAMEILTGKAATWYSTSAFSLNTLTADIRAGDLIVMDTTNSSSLPYGLVGNHAYMFEGLTAVNGVQEVRLGNPWGSSYNPQLIPFTKLAAAGIVEIDVGHV